MIKAIKNKRIVALFMIIISITFGIMIFMNLKEQNLEFITNHINDLTYISLKNILIHIALLSISFLFSFIGLGMLFLLLYLIFESITIGFMAAFFYYTYHFSGIGYYIIYLLIYKVLLIFLIIILILKFFTIFRGIIKYLKKEQVNLTKTIINSVIIMASILIYDIILIIFN